MGEIELNFGALLLGALVACRYDYYWQYLHCVVANFFTQSLSGENHRVLWTISLDTYHNLHRHSLPAVSSILHDLPERQQREKSYSEQHRFKHLGGFNWS